MQHWHKIENRTIFSLYPEKIYSRRLSACLLHTKDTHTHTHTTNFPSFYPILNNITSISDDPIPCDVHICVQYSIYIPSVFISSSLHFFFFVSVFYSQLFTPSTNNTERDIFQNYIKSISWQINAYSISLFGAYFLCTCHTNWDDICKLNGLLW